MLALPWRIWYALAHAVCRALNAVWFHIFFTLITYLFSAGSIKQQLCLDLNQTEQNTASFYLPIAIKARYYAKWRQMLTARVLTVFANFRFLGFCRTKEIMFLQMDSRLSVSNLEAALQSALSGCADVCSSMESAARAGMDPASGVKWTVLGHKRRKNGFVFGSVFTLGYPIYYAVFLKFIMYISYYKYF